MFNLFKETSNQQAIAINPELDNVNLNNANAVLQAIPNYRQLIINNNLLKCLRDARGWLETEVILMYFQEVILEHRRNVTLLVNPENFLFNDNPTTWPFEEGKIRLLTYPKVLSNWQYALIPIWNSHHWFLAVAFRQNGIVRVFDIKRGSYLNNVYDRLHSVALLLFGLTHFDNVPADFSSFVDKMMDEVAVFMSA